MMVIKGKSLAIVMFLFLVPLKGFCWGRVGHQSVALLAEQNLDPNVKIQVGKILRTTTIDAAAIWPDQIKMDAIWAHTKTYHYSDISDGDTYWSKLNSLAPAELAQADMVRALIKTETILRDVNSSADQKQWALSFMVHFMGDLHQPLHAGRPEDRGGNSITLDYFGKTTNLHAVWDVSIIQNILNLSATAKIGDIDVKNYLNQLRQPTQKEINSWQSGYLVSWLNDSMVDRANIYKNGTIASQKYQDKYADIVNDQILKAGYRLAAWLNAIYSNQEFGGKEAVAVKAQLGTILGDASDPAVILEPQTAKADSINNYIELDEFCGHIDDD